MLAFRKHDNQPPSLALSARPKKFTAPVRLSANGELLNERPPVFPPRFLQLANAQLPRPMTFSPWSEAIVLLSVPAVFWHMLMLQIAARVSLRQRIVVSGIMLMWTAWAYASIRYNFDEPLFRGFPGRPFVYLATAAGLTWIFRHRLLGQGVSQQWLIALQLFRPIGLIFVLEESRGTLPWTFAYPAGWGDLAAGLLALAVLVRYPSGPVPASAVILVATAGLLDFASAFFFGFTSSASPLQLFAFDNPNRVLEYPLGLIPVFLVPYAVMAHLLSLAQLVRDRQPRLSTPLNTLRSHETIRPPDPPHAGSSAHAPGHLFAASTPMKRAVSTMLLALTSWLTGCAVGPPFRKTPLAREGGLLPDQPVLVVLSSVEHRPGMRRDFFKDTKAVLATMSDHPGLVGYAVRFEVFGKRAWTMTAWKDEASMKAFVRSAAHREAMRRSGETAQNIRFASLEMPLSAVPMSWPEAKKRLDAMPTGYPGNPGPEKSAGR